MTHPKVSIILPLLNTVKFISKRMESIFAQTYTDWELIVIDGYSDDGSWEFLQSFNDPRIQLIRRERKGIYDAWNAGVELASGKYIYIATSDDTMSSDCLEKMVGMLELHPDCGLCACGLDVIDESGQVIKGRWEDQYAQQFYRPYLEKPHIRRAPLDGVLHFSVHSVYLSITQLLISKKVFENFGLFPTQWGSAGDFAWCMRVTMFMDTVYIPEKLATWRMHAHQATKLEDDISKIRTMINITLDVLRYVKDRRPQILKDLQLLVLRDFYIRELLVHRLWKAESIKKRKRLIWGYFFSYFCLNIRGAYRGFLLVDNKINSNDFLNNVEEIRDYLGCIGWLRKIQPLKEIDSLSKKPRLLHIVPYSFYPPDGGGKLVIYNNLKSLSEHFSVELVVWMTSERNYQQGLSHLEEFCKVNVIKLVGYCSPLKRVLNILTERLSFIICSFRRYPIEGIDQFYSHPIVVSLIQEDFAVIQLEHSWWYHSKLRKRRGKLVVIEHNYEVEYWVNLGISMIRQGKFLRGLYKYICGWKVYFQEKEALDDADLILAISEKEREKIQGKLKITKKMHALSTGLSAENYADHFKTDYRLASSDNKVQMVYIGSLDLPQSMDSIKYFCDEISGLLNDLRYSLKVIGRNPGAELKRMINKCKDVDLIGYVDDVKFYIRSADIYVVPLRYGAGMRIKIIEAMMMGMPIISTSKGAEGIDLENSGILIADSSVDFSECIKRLSNSEDLRKEMGQKNRVYALNNFDWNRNFREKTLKLYLKEQ